MLYIVKTIASRIEKAKRLIKLLRMGLSDTQEVYQAAPYGTDSVPVKDAIAIYGPTTVNGDAVVIGYINANQLAAAGEHRTFSTDAAGEVQFYIWQKADGTCEIGGTGDFMVRYNELETAFNELNDKFNDLVTAFNAHTHPTAATGAPSTPTAVPGQIPATSSAADITPAKITEIKTIPSS